VDHPFPVEQKQMLILAVVVLYKQTPQQSETMRSLMRVFAEDPKLSESIRVLVWDNSPVPSEAVDLPFVLETAHSERNVGTSGSYNYAMNLASSRGCPWLLLLDQDTSITLQFLLTMVGYGRTLLDQPEVATVVPYIFSHGTLVSPRRLLSFNRVQQIDPTTAGLCKDLAYAVNSGTLLRVSALLEMGGYSDEFWLDLSDVYVFRSLHRRGRYMYLAADLRVEHSIASMDFDKEMSPQRYRNFLAAESAYVDLFLSPVERASQILRLLVRTFRQYRRYHNKIFSRIALEYLLQRLFLTRPQRLKRWRAQLRQRDIPAIADGKTVG
jgi:GT2 family glycosyltransferase